MAYFGVLNAGCGWLEEAQILEPPFPQPEDRLTCNSLQLGYFDGGLTYNIPESFREVVKNTIPAKRWGSIQELYNTVDYLIKTPYLTGQNINISGGII